MKLTIKIINAVYKVHLDLNVTFHSPLQLVCSGAHPKPHPPMTILVYELHCIYYWLYQYNILIASYIIEDIYILICESNIVRWLYSLFQQSSVSYSVQSDIQRSVIQRSVRVGAAVSISKLEEVPQILHQILLKIYSTSSH